MAEYIERDKLVAAILQLKSALNTGPARHNLKQSDIMRVIAEFPAADVVPVVRCKDCKHFREWPDGQTTCMFWTENWDMPCKADDFCSYGKRRAK